MKIKLNSTQVVVEVEVRVELGKKRQSKLRVKYIQTTRKEDRKNSKN